MQLPVNRMLTLRERQRQRHVEPAPNGAQAGFAMVEVLVSILVFAFGLLGLIGLEATAINFSVDAEDRNRAALFASDVASTLWLNNSASPTAAQKAIWSTNIANTALATGLPSGTVSVVPNTAFTNYAGTVNAADITITWKAATDKTSTVRTLTTRVILP